MSLQARLSEVSKNALAADAVAKVAALKQANDERAKEFSETTAGLLELLSDDNLPKLLQLHFDKVGVDAGRAACFAIREATLRVVHDEASITGKPRSVTQWTHFLRRPITHDIVNTALNAPAVRERVLNLKEEGVAVRFEGWNKDLLARITFPA